MKLKFQTLPTSIVLFSVMIVFLWQGIYLPKNYRQKESKLFSVEEGQSVLQIAKNLEKENLIRNRFFFEFFVILNWSQSNLQAGSYELNPAMNTYKIARKIVSGEIFQLKVIIPEGFTLKQIEGELSAELQRPVFCKLTAGDFKGRFDFLEGVSDKANLEGFLFPDTYYFSLKDDDNKIFKRFLDNFNKKITPNLKNEIKLKNKSVFEIITMASLIEKEVKTLEDKKMVSGILWKRLKNGMPLQVDATITYITGGNSAKISTTDTKIDSPYNTYKYRGLPIGPICNPGFESIMAALYPKDNNYWFYLSTPVGETIFSKTLEEHNIAKSRYLK